MRKYIFILLIISFALSISVWQRNLYGNSAVLYNDQVENLEAEITELNRVKQEQNVQMKKLTEDNKKLEIRCESLENDLLSMKFEMLKNNLPQYWSITWQNISQSDGDLTKNQIDEINFLFQPTFANNSWSQVNPLSCFFTSYYEDIKDIHMAEFLRYFPLSENPEEFQEFEELRHERNWPFGDQAFDNMPVPIHRYKREMIQDIFTEYTGVSLDDLTGVGLDEIIYLKSTDSYYNYTSDFGPGVFKCNGGNIEDGTIRLYGETNGELNSVLTIIKSKDKYYIKSFQDGELQ